VSQSLKPLSYRPSSSTAAVGPVWSLGEDIAQGRVILVLVHMMHTDMPGISSGRRMAHDWMKKLTFADCPVSDTCAPGLDRKGRRILASHVRDHAGSSRFSV